MVKKEEHNCAVFKIKIFKFLTAVFAFILLNNSNNQCLAQSAKVDSIINYPFFNDTLIKSINSTVDLLGVPKDIDTTLYESLMQITLKYQFGECVYIKASDNSRDVITDVYVTRRSKLFKYGIDIGSKQERLEMILGKPSRVNGDTLQYVSTMNGEFELRFIVKHNKIAIVQWLPYWD